LYIGKEVYMNFLSPEETRLVSGGTSTYEVMAASAIVGICLGIVKSDPIWWGFSMATGVLISWALIIDDHMGFESKFVKLESTDY